MRLNLPPLSVPQIQGLNMSVASEFAKDNATFAASRKAEQLPMPPARKVRERRKNGLVTKALKLAHCSRSLVSSDVLLFRSHSSPVWTPESFLLNS